MVTTTTPRAELRGLMRRLDRLEATTAETPLLRRLKADPAMIFTAAGMRPDRWQAKLLRSTSSRQLLLCSRQAGKSLSAAGLALREALLNPPALVLLLSPTQRQSGELFRDKVKRLYSDLGRPVPTSQESQLTMELANGSRIISLPGDEETIRGYSGVNLLVIDEAARVPDDLYRSVRPMLAVSKGRLVALSTPFGQRGWFYQEWSEGAGWERTQINALACPRISREFLEEERRSLGDRWWMQEYMTSFEESCDSVFSMNDIQAALSDTVEPLFVGGGT
jgi:hypothetical protein